VLYHRRDRTRSGQVYDLVRRAGFPGRTTQVVRDYLAATGVGSCRVTASRSGRLLRVAYPLPTPRPLVSVLIPTRDHVDLLRRCLDGVLQRTRYAPLEVIIMDNDSREPASHTYFAELASDPRVHIVRFAGPFNWGAINNYGVRHANGSVVVLLNNDIEVPYADWLDELVSQALRPSVGVVGAKLLYADRTVQHAGIVLGPQGGFHNLRFAAASDPGYLDQLAIVRNVAAVTGACMAMRRTVFDEVGGLEENGLQVTWSDVDLCLRVRERGYRVIWTPHALLLHLELATRGADESAEQVARACREHQWMINRWGEACQRDPLFNPNLAFSEKCQRLVVDAEDARRWLIPHDRTLERHRSPDHLAPSTSS
jgi:O-antigen biosynthesis protein